MNELVLKNANLGLTMHKVNWNGVETVWGNDMRDALRWDSIPHMVRTIDVGKDYFKVLVSDLKSMGLDLLPILAINQDGRGRPQKYVYLVTRQGVMKLIATRRPHDIKDDPQLAAYLDKLQDWIFGEVLPAVMEHGAYMTPQVAQNVIDNPDNAIILAKALIKEHEERLRVEAERDEAIRRKGEISNEREAKILGMYGQLVKKQRNLERETEAKNKENLELMEKNKKMLLELQNAIKAAQFLDAKLKDKCSKKKNRVENGVQEKLL